MILTVLAQLKVEQKFYPADLRYERRTWHRILFRQPTPGTSTIRVIMKCYQNISTSYLEGRAQKDRGNFYSNFYSTVKELEGSTCWFCFPPPPPTLSKGLNFAEVQSPQELKKGKWNLSCLSLAVVVWTNGYCMRKYSVSSSEMVNTKAFCKYQRVLVF